MSALLYVGNLPHTCSRRDLAEVFSCIGQVLGAKISEQREWGDCHICGWVKVADEEAAARAVHYLNGHSFFGAHLVVRPAKRSPAARVPSRLH